MTTIKQRSLKIVLMFGLVGLLWTLVVQANTGYTFATNTGTGGLELTIDSETYYNGVLQPTLSWDLKNLVPGSDRFFNFPDVKPGDTGTTSISIHLKQNAAWVCLDFKNLEDSENGINEPESALDNNQQGELSAETEFFAWRDDGDNTFEVGEIPLFGTTTQSAVQVLNNTSYALSEYGLGQPWQPNQTKYVGVNWCAGDLQVNLATAKVTCNGETMGNEAQTDSFKVDISIRAVAASQQPRFKCIPPKNPPPVERCEIEGHKYDKAGNPLANWTIGLMKVLTHNNGTDVYDLDTTTTDINGYYCLEWDGIKRLPRFPSSYISGPYNFTYRVFERLQSGWQNTSVEKGPNEFALQVVPNIDVQKSPTEVSVQMGTQNGYIYANAAYHIDFYNEITPAAAWRKVKKSEKLTNTKKNVVARWNKLKNKKT